LADSTTEETIKSNCFTDREIQMAQNTPRNFLTRWLATFALVCIYCLSIVGASTLLLTASSTSADARGGGGRGFGRGGGVVVRGGRGRGWGRGIGYGVGVYGAGCFWNPYGRWVCPYY
jgi:uncharacterized membrane protein